MYLLLPTPMLRVIDKAVRKRLLPEPTEGIGTMKTSLTALIAGGTTTTASGLAHAQGYGYGYSDHPMMWNGMFMGPVMMILMIVIVAVAIVLVLKFLGTSGATSHGKGGQDNSLAILNERFAKGEIDKAEYEERKKAIGA